MSHISICRKHNLSRDKARELAEKMAVDLNERFTLNYQWAGDTLHFERSGVNGRVDIDDGEIRINVRLGFLLLPLKGRFEQSIHQYIDELTEGP